MQSNAPVLRCMTVVLRRSGELWRESLAEIYLALTLAWTPESCLNQTPSLETGSQSGGSGRSKQDGTESLGKMGDGGLQGLSRWGMFKLDFLGR